MKTLMTERQIHEAIREIGSDYLRVNIEYHKEHNEHDLCIDITLTDRNIDLDLLVASVETSDLASDLNEIIKNAKEVAETLQSDLENYYDYVGLNYGIF